MEEKKVLDSEQEVTFKLMSDLTVLAVKSQSTHDTLFEITGYGMNVQLNREKINSVEDVEGLLEGITTMFRKMILKELLDIPQKENS